jgi:hypothetical protein
MKQLLNLVMMIMVISCTEKHSSQQDVSFDDSGSIAARTSINHNTRDTTSRKIKKFISRYSFSRFQTSLYKGKLAEPDFTGNPYGRDQEYREFITNGCRKNGINFGGHYTIIHKGCGAMCEWIFVVDRVSGKVFTGTKPKDGRYGYLYRRDSKLLIANSNVFQDDSLRYYSDLFGEPELYMWNGGDFLRLQ